jgi:hypothetical protein
LVFGVNPRKKKKKMPIIADSFVKAVTTADLGVFGTALVGFLIWNIPAVNRKIATRVPLLYSIFALLPRALLPLFLLFQFGLKTRIGDGVTIDWIRPVFLAFAWCFGGLAQALVYVGGHGSYHMRWVVSTWIALGFTFMAIGSRQDNEDQRIIMLVGCCISLVFGAVVMLRSRRIERMGLKFLFWAEAIALCLYPVIFSLGHSMWAKIELRWEIIAYMVLDILAFIGGLFFAVTLAGSHQGAKAKVGAAAASYVPLKEDQQPALTL